MVIQGINCTNLGQVIKDLKLVKRAKKTKIGDFLSMMKATKISSLEVKERKFQSEDSKQPIRELLENGIWVIRSPGREMICLEVADNEIKVLTARREEGMIS